MYGLDNKYGVLTGLKSSEKSNTLQWVSQVEKLLTKKKSAEEESYWVLRQDLNPIVAVSVIINAL